MELISAHPDIALLFSDVVLVGGENGPELAQQARRMRPDLPVLFTTGYARGALPDLDGRSSPTRADYDVLRKPYTREELATRIREALDAHKK